jgi:phospholysine phosphohistidine inorganic pyrophosphate phosphatase
VGPRWRAVLLDIDGVLHVGDEPIPGALDALADLRARAIPHRLVTNTTSRPRRHIAGRLVGMGFDVADDDVLTPASLAVRHCREHAIVKVALFVTDELREDLAELEEADRDVDAVILGDLGEGFTWEVLNRAFGLLHAGAQLIALQRNRVWQRADGLVLDAGPFVAALEYATGREAITVGKPAAPFFQTALAAIGASADETVMVGDDVEGDVGGAQAAGLAGVLVRTGKYREADVAASGVEPTLTIDSIADLAELVAR